MFQVVAFAALLAATPFGANLAQATHVNSSFFKGKILSLNRTAAGEAIFYEVEKNKDGGQKIFKTVITDKNARREEASLTLARPHTDGFELVGEAIAPGISMGLIGIISGYAYLIELSSDGHTLVKKSLIAPQVSPLLVDDVVIGTHLWKSGDFSLFVFRKGNIYELAYAQEQKIWTERIFSSTPQTNLIPPFREGDRILVTEYDPLALSINVVVVNSNANLEELYYSLGQPEWKRFDFQHRLAPGRGRQLAVAEACGEALTKPDAQPPKPPYDEQAWFNKKDHN